MILPTGHERSKTMGESKSYVVRRAGGPVRLACDDPCWAPADRLTIDEFPWYESGTKQGTTAAMLYDDSAVYVLFICEDSHIHAREIRPNGDVYLDSCVELFAKPGAGEGDGYFNFEANCCGTVHLGFGPARGGRRLAGDDVLAAVAVAGSVPTPTRDETPGDDGWWLAAKLPFAAIGQLAGAKVAAAPGAVWRANFYRCGGKTDPQYACWKAIECEKPDFHRPEFFGTLTFE